MPVARRVLGESHEIMLWIRWTYAKALYKDDASTLDDLREAVNMLGETARTARRVLGGAHRVAEGTECALQEARAALRAREEEAREALHAREAQDAFRKARKKLAQERSELAQTLADASAKPSQDT